MLRQIFISSLNDYQNPKKSISCTYLTYVIRITKKKETERLAHLITCYAYDFKIFKTRLCPRWSTHQRLKVLPDCYICLVMCRSGSMAAPMDGRHFEVLKPKSIFYACRLSGRARWIYGKAVLQAEGAPTMTAFTCAYTLYPSNEQMKHIWNGKWNGWRVSELFFAFSVWCLVDGSNRITWNPRNPQKNRLCFVFWVRLVGVRELGSCFAGGRAGFDASKSCEYSSNGDFLSTETDSPFAAWAFLQIMKTPDLKNLIFKTLETLINPAPVTRKQIKQATKIWEQWK